MLRRFEQAREQAITQAIQPDGTSVTSTLCDWFNRDCEQCGHTFREGDRVRVTRTPDGTELIWHLDPLLNCGGGVPPAEVATDALTARFHQAMDEAVKPPEHLRLHRLTPGDPLLRFGAGGRPTCLQCTDTFRTFEVVVRCPCGELDTCQVALHRDPQRGLPCFDEHWPDLTVDYCPLKKRLVTR